jgi:hypothetical protein
MTIENIMNIKLKRSLPYLVLGALFITGCSVFGRGISSPQSPASGGENASVANGEQIYFTSIDAEGNRIPYKGGPDFGGMMMGSYLTCASCHGPEARGGVHMMHMQVMDAPDIRYVALSNEEHEQGQEQGEEHTDQHSDYDLEDFRQAVVQGKHPDGDPLDEDMPRWQMNDKDLADLFAFLKSIP